MSNITSCPNCQAKNRLGIPPKGQLPVCGKCGQHLPWLVNASDSSFEAELETDVPVLVDFWAPWCGPCRMVGPVLESLSQDHAGKLKVVKVNSDENPMLSQRFQVRSIPMLMVFQQGESVETIIGALPKQQLEQKLRPFLAS